MEITQGNGARVAFDPIAGCVLQQLAEALAEDRILIEPGALSTGVTPFPLFPVLASGALKPVIDRVFPLDPIVDPHHYLESNQQFGKIVVAM